MEVSESDFISERKFIAAIINHAIEDAKIHKNPKPPYIAINIHKKYIQHFKIVFTHIEIFIKRKRKWTINALKLLNELMEILKSIIQKIKSYSNELLAYEARTFFNSKNKLFNKYCFFLDIDPEYLERKAKAYFQKYDQGLVA